MLDLVFVDNRLAFSPAPTRDEISEVTKTFDCVVALASEEETRYSTNVWRIHRLKVLYEPIPETKAPNLIRLYEIINWILDCIRRGGKTLVYCTYGCGPSSTVAAAYLVHRHGLTAEEAIAVIRGVKPLAVESRVQEATIEAYELLLRGLGIEKLRAVVDYGYKLKWGQDIEHASKATQLALKLWKLLNYKLSLEEPTLAPLAVASLLHDIGEAVGEPHHLHSYKLILTSKQLTATLSEWETMVAALLALHHEETSYPHLDPHIASYADTVPPLAALLRIADGLDYTLNQVVEDVDVAEHRRRLVIRVICSKQCRSSLRKARERTRLLEDLLGIRVYVREA